MPGGSQLAVEFRLLGDVEARVGGLPVDLGHARQRTVLAALLIEANRTVPVDQLLYRVWDEQSPQRARSALYSYLSRLRRCLVEADGVTISRQSGGYLLTVSPSAVDLHHFRHLIGQARSAGDEQALALLDEALGLWRGEAFAELDTPWLNSLRETLAQERFGAELERAEAALRLGQHARMLPELSALARSHPLDERLAGQLMLALYRSGRQADALAHYQRTRQLLVDELGTDPGPALQARQRQILEAEPSLDPPPTTIEPASTRAPVPRQLPARPPLFIGRSAELVALTTPDDTRLWVICGTGGVGKTWLVSRWAHDNLWRFPDGQLWVNLRGFEPAATAVPPSTAVRGILDALGVPAGSVPTDLDAQIGLYRSLVAEKRMLIVLDNARDAEQVRPLLPGGAGCLVLVTSRNQMSGLVATEAARSLTLDLLTADESRALLAGRLGIERVSAEPEAVDQIVAGCARLSLALAVVAARAASHPGFPLADLAAELHNPDGALDAFDSGDPLLDVRAALSWSYRAISPPAARVFRLLGLHPGPDISVPAVASLAGLPINRVRPLLAELSRAHLIAEQSPGRYACHDLLRAYATELGQADDPEPERHRALRRLIEHYLHTAYRAAQLLDPHRDPIDPDPPGRDVAVERPDDYEAAMGWLTAEHPVLVAVIGQAAEHGFDTRAWQLAWSMVTYFDRRGHWHDRLAIQHAALASAARLGDLPMQAISHRDLARAYTLLGRYPDAHRHLREAFDLLGLLGDHVGQAHTHLNLSMVYQQQGELHEAIRHDLLSLDLYRATGHQSGEANALNNTGWHYAQVGDYPQALDYCEKALVLHEEIGNRVGEANTWDSLGFVHHHTGDYTRAAACFQHAIDLARTLGTRYGEAEALHHLGDTRLAGGDPVAARAAWRQARTILLDIGHPEAEDVAAKLDSSEPL
ncbi:BTAD domain-containing putative transcriptional regulator [Micromonospora sp. NPDC004704]